MRKQHVSELAPGYGRAEVCQALRCKPEPFLSVYNCGLAIMQMVASVRLHIGDFKRQARSKS